MVLERERSREVAVEREREGEEASINLVEGRGSEFIREVRM